MSGDTDSTRSSSKNFDYTLELDLHLFFTPLMQDYADGIVFTRTLRFPFPPANKIAIGGHSIEGDYKRLGYRLRDTIWDVDRERFMGSFPASAESSLLRRHVRQ